MCFRKSACHFQWALRGARMSLCAPPAVYSKILLPQMVFTTFWKPCFQQHQHKVKHFCIFQHLIEYFLFLYLKNAVWTPLLTRCIFQGGRSHARGVAKVRNVIPMLRGDHFVWFPCSVGMRILLFSTPLRWECSKKNLFWKPPNDLITFRRCAGHVPGMSPPFF